MDFEYKFKAYKYAMEFESIYNYSDQYKVNDNPTVWKYMSLDKLDSLLTSNAMFFAKPSAFLDPLEGSYSKWDLMNFKDEGGKITPREYMKKIQEFSGISCWHMNEYESAGMWDLYLGGNDGVAIKTDYRTLINSLTDLRYRVFSGKLQYVDFRNEMTSRNIYDTLFYKRKSFAHENELRLMIIASRINENYLERFFESKGILWQEWQDRMDMLEEESYEFTHEKGTMVKCNLDDLISCIYVSPKSSKKVVTQVKAMVARTGLNEKVVIQSDLYKDFIY